MTISPKLPELMNLVGNKIPNTWYEVGIQLHIEPPILRTFSSEERTDKKCYIRVLHQWKQDAVLPYTWDNLIKALEAIGENERVRIIKNYLMKKDLH